MKAVWCYIWPCKFGISSSGCDVHTWIATVSSLSQALVAERLCMHLMFPVGLFITSHTTEMVWMMELSKRFRWRHGLHALWHVVTCSPENRRTFFSFIPHIRIESLFPVCAHEKSSHCCRLVTVSRARFPFHFHPSFKLKVLRTSLAIITRSVAFPDTLKLPR